MDHALALASHIHRTDDIKSDNTVQKKKIQLQEFAEPFYRERIRAGFDLSIVWLSLSPAIQKKYPLSVSEKGQKEYTIQHLRRNLVALKKYPDLMALIPLDLAKAFLNSYASLPTVYPTFTDKVSSEELLYIDHFDPQNPLYVSARIAKEQIRDVMKQKGLNWNPHLLKKLFSKFMRKKIRDNSVSFNELFDAPDHKPILRVLVAVAMAALEDRGISQQAIDVLKSFPVKSDPSPIPIYPVTIKSNLLSFMPVPLSEVEEEPATQANVKDVFAEIETIDLEEAELGQADVVEVAEKPKYMGYDEFNSVVEPLERAYFIKLEKVPRFLPEKFRYDFRRFFSAREDADKRPALRMPSEIVPQVIQFFDGLPKPDQPAQEKDITIEAEYNNLLHIPMLNNVAQQQIAKAMAACKKTPRCLIDEMVVSGYAERNVQLLLEGKTRKLVSRKYVAAIIQKMDVGYEVAEVSPLKMNGKRAPEVLLNVLEIIEPLKKKFDAFHSDGNDMPKAVYQFMNPVDRKTIRLKDIRQWFDGGVTHAPEKVVGAFIKAANAKLTKMDAERQEEIRIATALGSAQNWFPS